MMYARPLLEDGSEAFGQPAPIGDRWVPVLSGEYQSLETFVRYRIRRYGNDHARWNIYFGSLCNEPTFVLTVLESDYRLQVAA